MIPVRDGESYVAQAIDSVMAQKGVTVECIVVDDGSIDATPAILDSYGGRIKRLESPGIGVAGARNKGAKIATAPFLAFLDADDVWLPRKSAIQLEALERDERLGLSFTALHLIDQHGNFTGRVTACGPVEALANTLLLEKPFMTGIGSSVVVRRAAFDAIGGFDERLSTSADCCLACKVALRWSVHAVPQPMVLYRVHSAQMHKDPEATRRDMERVFDDVFGDHELPAELRGARRRAEANLDISLAGSYLRQRRLGRFLWHAARACVLRPDRVVAAIRRLSRPGGGMSRAS